MTKIILHHTSMRSTKYGGIEQFIVNLNQQLKDADNRIIIQYESRPDSEIFCDALNNSGSELLTQVTHSSPWGGFANSLKLYLQTRPTLIITHFLSAPQYIAGMLYRVIAPKTRFVSIFHLTPGLSRSSVTTLCLNRFSAIIPVSISVQGKLSEAGIKPYKIKQRYLGVFIKPEQIARLLKGREQLRKQMGLSTDHVVVGCLLFNHPVKGADILIRAFADAYANNRNLHLLLVGIKPDEDFKKLLTEQHLPATAVTTPGIITNHAIARMSAADIYVQPSRKEALGLALIEAAALGLPLIGANTGGIPEIVRDGITGELFPPDDYQQLAILLSKFSRNPSLRSRYGSAAAAHYQKYFDGHTNIQHTAEIVSGQIHYPSPEASLIVRTSASKLPRLILAIFEYLQQNGVEVILKEPPGGVTSLSNPTVSICERIATLLWPELSSKPPPAKYRKREAKNLSDQFFLDHSGEEISEHMLHILVNRSPLLLAPATILKLLAKKIPLAEIDILKGDRRVVTARFSLVADSVGQSQEKLAKEIAELIKSVLLDGYQTAPVSHLPQSQPTTLHTSVHLLSTFLTVARRRVVNAARRRLFREHWSVALATIDSPSDLAQLRHASWQIIDSPVTDNYIADPFLFEDFGHQWILAEEFDRTANKGFIVAYRLAPGGPPERQKEPLLIADTHLSYPFTFEHDGQKFIMPENADSGTLSAYPLRFINNQLQVGPPQTIGINEPVYDATLFCYGQYFWVVGSTTPLDTNTHLTFWYSSTPFGPWERHFYNPVTIDVRYGRPAGSPFTINNQLHLPLQNGAQKYGDQVNILTVTDLSPSTIDMKISATISKQDISVPGQAVNGIHTVNFLNDKVVIDYYSYLRPSNRI